MVTRDTSQAAIRPEQLWIGGNNELSRLVEKVANNVHFNVTVFEDAANLNASPIAGGGFSPTLALVLASDLDSQVGFLSKWVHQPFLFLALAATRDRRNSVITKLVENQVASRVVLERIIFPATAGVSTLSVDELAICIVAHLIQNRFERRISVEAASRIRSPSLIT